MNHILNCQMSLFGPFEKMTPEYLQTNQITGVLIKKGFIPSIVLVDYVDPIKREIVTTDRLQMSSKDQIWQIVFLSERIDINYVYNNKTKCRYSLRSITSKSKSICSLVFKTIKEEIQGTRIALNSRFLMKNKTSKQKHYFINRIINIEEIGVSNSLLEWGLHVNQEKCIAFGRKRERCNSIVNIRTVPKIKDSPCSQIVTEIGLDINTTRFNDVPKYTYSDLLCFTDSARILMDDSLDKIEGKK